MVENRSDSLFNLKSKSIYAYKSGQFIKGIQNLNLIFTLLTFKTNQLFNNNINIELLANKEMNLINFNIIEKLCLNNYIPPNLRYKDIKPCFLIQKNQFISNYSVLGYLEALTQNSLEIVKFKTKNQTSKQIFLISNNDCLVVKKTEIGNKKLNDFVTSKSNLAQTGKIIIENENFVTIQCGRPYFFPNCKNENLISKTNLEYKIVPASRIPANFKTNKKLGVIPGSTI